MDRFARFLLREFRHELIMGLSQKQDLTCRSGWRKTKSGTRSLSGAQRGKGTLIIHFFFIFLKIKKVGRHPNCTTAGTDIGQVLVDARGALR